jgi:hypothetical protein
MGERINRLFDTYNDSQDAFLDAIRSGNERTYRFSKIVIEEAGRTQREQSELAKQWMEAPLDPIGLTKSAMDTWTRRTRRRFELGRTLFSDLVSIGDETRDTVQRVVEANREAIGVGVSAGRDAASRAGREVSDRLEDASDAVDEAARNVRSNARKRSNGS